MDRKRELQHRQIFFPFFFGCRKIATDSNKQYQTTTTTTTATRSRAKLPNKTETQVRRIRCRRRRRRRVRGRTGRGSENKLHKLNHTSLSLLPRSLHRRTRRSPGPERPLLRRRHAVNHDGEQKQSKTEQQRISEVQRGRRPGRRVGVGVWSGSELGAAPADRVRELRCGQGEELATGGCEDWW